MPTSTKGKRRRTDEEIRDALMASFGNLAVAARRLGYSRRHLDEIVKASEELTQARATAYELRVDVAEGQLQKLVNAGDFRAIKYTLEKKGKHRGWGADPAQGDSGEAAQTQYANLKREVLREALNPTPVPADSPDAPDA